jgi:hypothetical protein
MKKIIALAAMASVSAFAHPNGYIAFAKSGDEAGEIYYINMPKRMHYDEGSNDEIYEFTTWTKRLGFFTELAICKTPGLVRETSINRIGAPIADRFHRYPAGSIGYKGWEFACLNNKNRLN